MEVKVNREACIGCGACTVIADNIFQIGDDGLAEVINPIDNNDEKVAVIKEEDIENVQDASESCPTGAIELIENEEEN